MSNVFKIRHGKETHVYRTEAAGDKKHLLSQFRQVAEELSAKRRKEREAEHGRRKSLYTADVCIFLQCKLTSSDIGCYSDPRWFST